MPDAIDLTEAPLPRAVVREAARWLMRLHAGPVTEAQRAAWTRWRSADPQHERAWHRAEQWGQRLAQLPPAVGLQVLDRPRRAALRTLALLVAAAPVGDLAWHSSAAEHTGGTAAHHAASGDQHRARRGQAG